MRLGEKMDKKGLSDTDILDIIIIIAGAIILFIIIDSFLGYSPETTKCICNCVNNSVGLAPTIILN